MRFVAIVAIVVMAGLVVGACAKKQIEGPPEGTMKGEMPAVTKKAMEAAERKGGAAVTPPTGPAAGPAVTPPMGAPGAMKPGAAAPGPMAPMPGKGAGSAKPLVPGPG